MEQQSHSERPVAEVEPSWRCPQREPSLSEATDAARLVTSAGVVLLVLAAGGFGAIVSRALAPTGGSLNQSPLPGFLTGVAAAVVIGVRMMRWFQNHHRQLAPSRATDVLPVLRLFGRRMGPALAALWLLTAVANWWEPTRPLSAMAITALACTVIVAVPGSAVIDALGRSTVWLPRMGPPDWLVDLRRTVVAPAIGAGVMVLLALPATVAAFNPDRWGTAGVGRAWLGVWIVALASAMVGATVGGDTTLGNRLLILRAVTGLASVGVTTWLTDDPQVALVVIGLGGFLGLLADTESVARFDATIRGLKSGAAGAETAMERPTNHPAERQPEPSFAATAAQVAVVVLGLFFLAVGGPGDAVGNTDLALGLVLVGVLELTVVGLVLRPFAVDEGPAFHRIMRPLRVAWHGTTKPAAVTAARGDLHRSRGRYSLTEDERSMIAELIRKEFRQLAWPTALLNGPSQPRPPGDDLGDQPSIDISNDGQVYLAGTPLADQWAAYRCRIEAAGLRIEGGEPELQRAVLEGGRNPMRVQLVVDHPAQRLVDAGGRLVGHRPSIRKWGTVWLVPGSDGSGRVAESVEQGSEPLPALDLTVPLVDEADSGIDVDRVGSADGAEFAEEPHGPVDGDVSSIAEPQSSEPYG